MVDYYTKWTEAFSVPNHTVLTVANKLVAIFSVDLASVGKLILTKVVNLNLNFLLPFVIN